MIQILTFSGKEANLKGKDVEVNRLHDARSLDEFDINIILLSDTDLWTNKNDNVRSIDTINDFKSLSIMIDRCQKTNIIIGFPQNIKFRYHQWSNQKFIESCELKDMLSEFRTYIMKKLYVPLSDILVVYEKTITNIENNDIDADFYLDSIGDILTKSSKSNKPTTIRCGKEIITTLNLDTYDKIMGFLRSIKLIKEKESMPEWLKEVKMFDDEKQLKAIEDNHKIIKAANDEIGKAMEVINRNNKYKSIMYTSGDELVETVFDILETMLGVNLADFQDKKKEDFRFEINGITYLGEVKGISSNVKSQNLTQLEMHHQSYLDEHPEVEDENIKMILIINHQRNIALQSRSPIDQKQIDVAKRYGSLIVESYTLLKLFEKYLNEEISREDCINLLSSNTGLLVL